MSVEWQVGAILNEPLADTLRFAAWYLEMGASKITLFFDNPQDPAIRVLGNHAKISCVPCDAAFWASVGMSPNVRFVRRQIRAITDYYRRQSDGWFLNVDCDEFLYAKNGTVSDFLATVGGDVDFVRVETAEVVSAPHLHSGLTYRMPMDRAAASQVYLDDKRFFGPRRRGLIGHPQGKCLVRAGNVKLKLRQHWPEHIEKQLVKEQFEPARGRMALLHHIGLDYDVWRKKLDWRLGANGFTVPLTEQLENAMSSEAPEEGLKSLYQALHSMDAQQVERLEAAGARLPVTVDFDSITRRHFPDALH